MGCETGLIGQNVDEEALLEEPGVVVQARGVERGGREPLGGRRLEVLHKVRVGEEGWREPEERFLQNSKGKQAIREGKAEVVAATHGLDLEVERREQRSGHPVQRNNRLRSRSSIQSL